MILPVHAIAVLDVFRYIGRASGIKAHKASEPTATPVHVGAGDISDADWLSVDVLKLIQQPGRTKD